VRALPAPRQTQTSEAPEYNTPPTTKTTAGSIKTQTETDLPEVFGSEFSESRPVWVDEENSVYTDYKGRVTRTITPEKRERAMQGFDKLRLSFVLDSVFVSCLGLCAFWAFGTYQDATSYALGALLGTMYSVLLSKVRNTTTTTTTTVGDIPRAMTYRASPPPNTPPSSYNTIHSTPTHTSLSHSKFVEGVGNETRRTSQLGSLRFAPVILLVLLYSKNRESISFLPEFVGFFSFQLGSLLQAFNSDAYGEKASASATGTKNWTPPALGEH